MNKTWWNHFLYLEELLLSSEKHVAFIEDNFGAVSINFMHIILATCADIECIFKECLSLDKRENAQAITDKLIRKHSDFHKISILFLPMSLEIKPWEESKDGKIPEWWSTYNAIKHNKNDKPYRGACLEYAVYALAALFTANLVYYTQNHGKDFSAHKVIKLPKLFEYPGLGPDGMLLESSYNVSVPGFDSEIMNKA